MSFPFYIARRYLFSKKQHNVINLISGISVVGVALATLAMVCVMSGGSTSLEQQIIWDASYAFGFLSILRKCRQVFIKNTERVTSWHMRPMISMR